MVSELLELVRELKRDSDSQKIAVDVASRVRPKYIGLPGQETYAKALIEALNARPTPGQDALTTLFGALNTEPTPGPLTVDDSSPAPTSGAKEFGSATPAGMPPTAYMIAKRRRKRRKE